MLTDIEVTQLCERLGLSQAARAVIEEVRTSEPSRRVGGGAGNNSGFTCSPKMGVTIQYESSSLERAAGFIMDLWEKHTLEFYDQPPEILLHYKDKNGRNRGHWYTPDYFKICHDEIGWEEYKPESVLQEKSQKSPNLYTLGEDGEWHCTPAEEYAAQFGFFFRVRTSVNTVLFRNLKFLKGYYLPHCLPPDTEIAARVMSVVSDEPGILLVDLRKRLGDSAGDCIHKMIVEEQLYVDLEHYPLAEPDRVQVFANVEVARSCLYVPQASIARGDARWARVEIDTNQVLDWDGRAWQVINIGDKETALQLVDASSKDDGERLRFLKNAVFQELLQQGKIRGVGKPGRSGLTPEGREIWLAASKDDLAGANSRFRIIRPVLGGQQATNYCAVPARTVRNWVAKYREAEKEYGWGYIGLLDRSGKRGNHDLKVTGKPRELMLQFIENEYENVKAKAKKQVYSEYLDYCEKNNIGHLSHVSFWKEVNKRPQYEQVKAREGARAAYALEPTYWELTVTTPRHGDRPWECVHMDHALLPILIRDSLTGKILGLPWLSLAKDANSRRNLGCFVSFDKPSYRSNMMVLRDIARRFHRLAETFITDKGPDFEGIYWETVLAIFWSDKLSRPTAKPRHGAPLERYFGTTKQQFIYNLRGNTRSLRNVRRVSSDRHPKKFVVWTLDKFCQRLEEYLFEHCDLVDHPALGQSPREAYMLGMAQGGWRHHQYIEYDEDFIIATMPTTKKGTARVQRSRGVKISYDYFDAPEFDDEEVIGTEVPVRYDPFDAGTARAYVKGKWVVCTSKHKAILAGRSQRQIAMVTAELRKRNQNHARNYINDTRIAQFIKSAEGDELLLLQQAKERETRRALALIQGEYTLDSAENQGSNESEPANASGYVDGTKSSSDKIVVLKRLNPASQADPPAEEQSDEQSDELVQRYGGYYAS